MAWAAGLRGFMAQIVREDSSVSWSGTFGYILLPGLLIGLLLGWAEHLRSTGGRRRWRWLALSPLLFAAILFSEGPLGVLGIFEDGLGGGAIGVPLYAMAGGYAISGRGPRWGRLACGALALTAIPIWALTVESFAGADLAVTTPRGLWVAALLLLVPRAVHGRCRYPASARSRRVAAARRGSIALGGGSRSRRVSLSGPAGRTSAGMSGSRLDAGG